MLSEYCRTIASCPTSGVPMQLDLRGGGHFLRLVYKTARLTTKKNILLTFGELQHGRLVGAVPLNVTHFSPEKVIPVEAFVFYIR